MTVYELQNTIMMGAPHNHQGKVVLVVDHDEDMRNLLSEWLSEIGLQVVTAIDGHETLQLITQVAPHVVLTELRLPEGGFEYVRQLRAHVPSCPIMLLTPFGTPEAKAEAKVCGVRAFLEKPIKARELQQAVLAVLKGLGEPRQEY